jgi:hypothetical protein
MAIYQQAGAGKIRSKMAARFRAPESNPGVATSKPREKEYHDAIPKDVCVFDSYSCAVCRHPVCA